MSNDLTIEQHLSSAKEPGRVCVCFKTVGPTIWVLMSSKESP